MLSRARTKSATLPTMEGVMPRKLLDAELRTPSLKSFASSRTLPVHNLQIPMPNLPLAPASRRRPLCGSSVRLAVTVSAILGCGHLDSLLCTEADTGACHGPLLILVGAASRSLGLLRSRPSPQGRARLEDPLVLLRPRPRLLRVLPHRLVLLHPLEPMVPSAVAVTLMTTLPIATSLACLLIFMVGSVAHPLDHISIINQVSGITMTPSSGVRGAAPTSVGGTVTATTTQAGRTPFPLCRRGPVPTARMLR